jgi:endo-1,4-beta-xylanase
MRCSHVVALSFALLCGYPANASVVATYDFEGGTVQGWSSFGGAGQPANTTADAFSGTHSLLDTTNASGGGGPGISLSSTLLPGAKYTITGELKLTPGEAGAFADFTMRRSDPACSGGTCFDTIGSFEVPVTSAGWAQIGGSYSVSPTESGLFLYAQLVGPATATSFYVDDVVVDETAAPPPGAPEPGTVWLVAAPLLALILLRRRSSHDGTSHRFRFSDRVVAR